MSIRDRITAWRNHKLNNALADATKHANQLHAEKGSTVVCIYCGKLLPKSEAAFVYNLEERAAEFSHEECWAANNVVHKGWPEPLGTHDAQEGAKPE